MESHTLTTDDFWFIEKGWKDSLSRTPFEVGQTIVVCENRHVMLAEFYDGVCPTCKSNKTMTFSRQNLELGVFRSYIGECPKCYNEVTILFRQDRKSGSFIGRCPKCNSTHSLSEKFFTEQVIILKYKKYFRRVNLVLGGILGVLVACIFILIVTGNLQNAPLIEYSENVIFPRTQEIYTCLFKFINFDKFYYVFIEATNTFIMKNEILFENIIFHFSMLIEKNRIFGEGLREHLRNVFNKTNDLIELFEKRTRIIISNWGERRFL